jgi:hypothetical protein
VCGPIQNVEVIYNSLPSSSSSPSGAFLSDSVDPAGKTKGKGKVDPAEMITSLGTGIPAPHNRPSPSVMSWFGMNPIGRIRSLGRLVPGLISTGFATPPPVPV